MKTVLFVSDSQSPYHHPDTLDFLDACAQWVKPDRVIHLGDEVDNHSYSRFVKNPELASARYEEEMAYEFLQELQKRFRVMELVYSNHTARPYLRAEEAGITNRYLKPLNEVWGCPKWVWKDHIMLEGDGVQIRVEHGESVTAFSRTKETGLCFVQGHRHQEFYCQYTNNGHQTVWGVQAGCLIDRTHPAFKYGKHHRRQPMLGTCAVVNGHPVMIPLIESAPGKWCGHLV